MSGDWHDYFEYKEHLLTHNGDKYYEYKDKNVKSLPANLPMPHTKSFYNMFSGCWQLRDITALSNWDVSNVTSMDDMFVYCNQLQDISALANWDVSNVTSMDDVFRECHRL